MGDSPHRWSVQALVRLPHVATTLLVVLVLAALNVIEHVLHGNDLVLAPGAAAVLLLLARASGLSWAQLGLARDRVRSGAAWGGGVVLVVGVIYAVGVLLPLTRPAFLDVRYQFGAAGALVSAFVVIPIGTVLIEEVAFRSVLWGMLARHSSPRRVLLISSVLFGLWHVLPSLNLATANRGIHGAVSGAGSSAVLLVVVGTVLFTAAGGLIAGELRRRSGSLIASAGMHWATNSLGVLFGVLAWRIAG